MSQFTRVLDQVQQGNERAAEELLPLVYEELRKLAAADPVHGFHCCPGAGCRRGAVISG